MSWADKAIELLSNDESAIIKPRGNSMTPKIKSGETITLEPCDAAELKINDVVLCKVKSKVYLHLVKAKQGSRVLIGNNHGKINGWTNTVYGKVIKIGE